jgi:PAS domain S-box-containing protein
MKKDKDETKEQLAEEPGKLLQKLRKLEAAETRRKQTERILKESEEKYKLLVETSNDMIFTVDLKGNFLFANKAFKKNLGYSKKEIKKINGFKLVHPEDMSSVTKQFAQLVEGKKVDNMEYRYKAKNGSYIHILNNASPIFGPQGNVIAAFGIARNISQRKKMEEELRRAHDELERRVEKRTSELVSINKKLEKEIKEREKIEQALREGEEKYRSIFESFHDVYYRTDKEGKIILISPSVYSQAGYNPKQLIGRPVTDFYISPSDRKGFLQELKKSGVINDYELKLKAKNGRVIDASANSRIIFRKDGEPVGVEGVLRNITERKIAEAALKESEQKFKNIFEGASDGMILLDRTGRILDVNKKAVEVYGGTKKEILGKHFSKMRMLTARNMPKIMPAFANTLAGKKAEVNIVIKNKKGQEIILECSGSLIHRDSKPANVLIIARDVTEKKTVEEALKESEEKYREIVELAPDGILTIDLKGVITSCNTAFLNLAGASKGNIVGKHFTKLPRVRPRDIPKYIKMFNTLIKGKVPKPLEIVWHRKDGTTRIGEFHVSLMKKGRKTTGIQIITRDITERKKVEESLRKSEENYRQLADSIADVFFEMDKDLRYTYWNKASENLTGISAEKALGKSLYELFPEIRGTKAEKFYLKALKTNKSVSFVNEYQLNGRSHFFEINAYPSQRGLSVFVKDITERKKVEEEIKGSEERLKILFEFAPDAYYLNDLKGNFIDGNIAAQKLTGYKREELIGKNFLKLKLLPLLQIPKAASLLAKNARGQATGPDEFDLTRKDGTQVSVEIRTFPVKIEGKTVVLGIAHDITERKMARQVLQESEEKFRNLAEQSPNMIFINKKGKVVYANKKCEEIMGYTREEFYSPDFDFSTLIAPESQDLIRASFKKHTKGQNIPPYEYTLVTKYGQRIEAIITTRLINYNGVKAILGIITDITKHKRTEQELSIRDWAIKSSISAIALADLEGNLIYVNDSFLRLWGYGDEKEVIGQPAIKFWRAADEASNVIKALRDKWNWIGELEAMKKDGSTFDAQLSASMVTDANGNPICMMASFIDITERKWAEKVQTSLYKISESAHSAKNLEELYYSIHNIINELMPANNFYIALYDSTSEMLSFPYFVDEYEQNPGPQKLGKGLTEYVLRTEKPLLASPKVFDELIKKSEIVSVGPPSIDWLGVPLKTTDETIGVLTVQSYTEGIRYSEKDKSILTFISEQVAMAIERKIAEEKYHSLYSAMDEGVCLHEIIYDDKGKTVDYRFIDINPAYESITGLRKENVVGKKASELYRVSSPPFMNIFAKVAETREPALIETYFPPLKKYFIISAFSPEKGKFATVFTDITERYNTERELIEAKNQAEKALKKLKRVQSQLIQSERLAALGKLSAGIAHEINNPLSIISGYTQMLLMDKISDSPELKEALETIKRQVDRASSITDQLLQFSKKIKPEFKKSDVNDVVKNTLNFLRQQLVQDNIKIVQQLSSNPTIIHADPSQLQQVFLNLIANASHAMPDGGTLTINTMIKDANLEIIFTDTGCGIPEEYLNKLFEPFFTTKENGTGLGLSIAYGIIKAHKGNIKVKSEEGKGTTFTIILPYE